MSITFELPDGIIRDLEGQGGDVSRLARDGVAVEGYRTGLLSIGQVASMLGMGVIAAQSWLASRGVPSNYSLADFEVDCETINRIIPSGT